jgi:hypothetical protein
MTAREWLQEHGYDDVVRLIEQVEAIWVESGVTTRRNWWEVLAGDRNGKPRLVSGFRFPVLATAQEHEGKVVTANAIRRNPGETAPAKDFRGQWHRKARGKKRVARA